MKRRLAVYLGMILILVGVSVGSHGTELSNTKTVTSDGISVTISTDKQAYEVGETIAYEIEIKNDKYMWQVNSFEFEYSNSEGLVAADGTLLPTEVPIIATGESYSLTGALMGQNIGSEEATVSEEADTEAGDKLTKTQILMLIEGGIILGIAVLVYFLKKGKGNKNISMFILIGLMAGMLSTGVSVQAAEYETVKIRPYIEFTYGGEEVMIRAVMELHLLQTRLVVDSDQVDNPKKVSVHDPSIFKDFDGTYYIVGTHITEASTTDLYDWKSMDAQFKSSLSEDTMAQIRAWNKDGDSANNVGYLWAPDLIYNEAMGRYCIYLSANGDDWKSNIVLLTSDTIDGDYEYAGSVVMGGFTAKTYGETDVAIVTGEAEIADRYVDHGIANRRWGDMWPNVIDPCVFYDDDGKLWMSYGSWSGGIFMLELDEATGLRDYNVSYETDNHSDAYFGKKIAGGAYVSGEASYIQKIEDYYYLFISYGALEAKGGYNIRVFRSATPDGPYVDELGNSSLFDNYVQNFNLSVGIRLLGGYKWRSFTYGQVAQGHNSAFVDDDGKAYIVFHTRTTNGSEGHFVKVHQLFVNKEGWLVAAPYQTSGETLVMSGYSATEVAGRYELIIHEMMIEYGDLETKKPVFIDFNEDGSITGDHTGSWRLEPGTPYITLRLDGEDYSGLTLEMNIESTTVTTLTFTALGIDNQVTVWGSKMLEE